MSKVSSIFDIVEPEIPGNWEKVEGLNAKWNSILTDIVQTTAWTALLDNHYLIFKVRDCPICSQQ